jgi:hypothetical protein
MKIIVIICGMVLELAAEWRLGGATGLGLVGARAALFVLMVLVRLLWVALTVLLVVVVWGCLDGWGLCSDMASADESMVMTNATQAGKAGTCRKEDDMVQGGSAVGVSGQGGWKGGGSREASSAKKKRMEGRTIPGLCQLT